MASKQQFLPLGIAIGAGIGAIVGFIKDELTFYLGIGAVLGVILGVIVDQRNMVNREIKKSGQDKDKDNLIPKY